MVKTTSATVLIAFDFGMKRIGMAIGQTITKTARPLITLSAKNGIPNWQTLAKLCTKWQPHAFVVGIPLNMDGTPQKITEHALAFAKELRERFQLPVYQVDERLTTKDARERIFAVGGYKALQDGQVDQVAAQLILQNWLNENI